MPRASRANPNLGAGVATGRNSPPGPLAAGGPAPTGTKREIVRVFHFGLGLSGVGALFPGPQAAARSRGLRTRTSGLRPGSTSAGSRSFARAARRDSGSWRVGFVNAACGKKMSFALHPGPPSSRFTRSSIPGTRPSMAGVCVLGVQGQAPPRMRQTRPARGCEMLSVQMGHLASTTMLFYKTPRIGASCGFVENALTS